MKRKMKQDKLAKQISLALMAGMVTYTPVAFGMPVVDQIKTSQTTISDPTVEAGITVIDINGTGNNVINWKDFSIDHGEKVRFDNGGNVNNYANIVTGSATSFINGAMEGGNNVYLINPNGVIFGKGAEVNVGNLYVSTQGGLNDADYDDVTSAFTSPVTTTVASDVVNLGNIEATTVEVVGNNIRFLNTADIDASTVNIKVSGYVHLGHSVGSEATEVNDTHYKNETVATPTNYTVTELDGQTTKTADNYMLVRNLNELRNIKNNTAANYMLADDINKTGSATPFTPISDFSGNFDGMFYTVNNLNISGGGVFASTSGTSVRIENAGFVNVSVNNSEQNTGGIVGSAGATNTLLRNVYTTGGSVTGGDTDFTGGLVGYAAGTGTLKIESSYNNNSVVGASGILGTYDDAHIVMEDVYNMSSNVHYGLLESRGMGGSISVNRAYTTSGQIAYNKSGMSNWYDSANTPDWNSDSVKIKSKYSGWGSTISEEGGVQVASNNGNVTKSTWRIYAGQSLPMLTAFFKGTVQASYTGNFLTDDGSVAIKPVSGTAYEATSNNGQDITGLTYNSNKFSIIQDDKGKVVSYSGGVSKSDSHLHDDTQIRNAGRLALIYSDQLGYDLVGTNVTIDKRKVAVDASASIKIEKEYDGEASSTITDVSTSLHPGTDDTGIIDGDDIQITGSATLTFNDANVGSGKTGKISFTSISDPTGKDAANYDVEITTGEAYNFTNGAITPRALYLTVNATSDKVGKVYDGTSKVAYDYDTAAEAVTLDSTKILAGDVGKVIFGTDTSTVIYTDADGNEVKDAGTYNLSYGGIKLTGTSAGNYKIVDAVDKTKTYFSIYDGINPDGYTLTVAGTIAKRQVSLNNAIAAVTKEYDGNSSATVEGVTFALDPNKIVEVTTVVPSTTQSGGVISSDANSLVFALNPGAVFKNSSDVATANVADATKVSGSVSVTDKQGADAVKNYEFTDADSFSGAGSITPRNLTLTLGKSTGIEKDYDTKSKVENTSYLTFGENASENYVTYASGSKKTVEGQSASDIFTISADFSDENVNWVKGTDDKEVPGTKDVTYHVKVNNSNYTVTSGSNTGEAGQTIHIDGTASGTINPHAVNATFADITKVYDGTAIVTDQQFEEQVHISGVEDDPIFKIDQEAGKVSLDITADNYSGTYADKNAGTNIDVTYTSKDGSVLTLAGEHGKNYILNGTATGKGSITQRSVSADDLISKFDEIKKEYDTNNVAEEATTQAAKKSIYLEKLYVNGVTTDGTTTEDLAFTIAEAVYANGANVKDNTTATDNVRYKVNLSLSEDDLKNYGFVADGTNIIQNLDGSYTVVKYTTGTITPYKVTASVVNGNLTKTYDGKTTLGTGMSGDAIITFDSASKALMAIDGTYNDSIGEYKEANAGTADDKVQYTVKVAVQDGKPGDVGNYTFIDANENPIVNPLSGKGTINRREIKVAFDDLSKQYDGTSYAGRSLQTTDGISATVDNLAEGDDYDASVLAVVSGTNSNANYVNNNGVAVVNAGEATKVKYTNVSSGLGDKAANYIIKDSDGNVVYSDVVTSNTLYGNGSIEKREISADNLVFEINDVTKVYDGTTEVDGSYKTNESTEKQKKEDFVKNNGPYVTIEDSGVLQLSNTKITSAVFGNLSGDTFSENKNITANKVRYQAELSPEDLKNFTVTSGTLSNSLTAYGNAQITKRNVTLSAAADTKIYDGTTASSGVVTADNLVNGDKLIATQVFDNANVQSAVHVISVADGYTIKDANNADMTANYNVTPTPQTAAGVINPAPIKVQFKDVTKDYDGTVAVTDTNRGIDTTTGSVDDQVYGDDDVKLAELDYDVKKVFYNLGANVKDNEGKTNNVTYSGLKLEGAQAGNYILANVNGTPLAGDATNGYTAYGNGTIAQKVLSGPLIIKFDDITKTYNNNVIVVPDGESHKTVESYINTAKAGTDDLVYSVVGAEYEQKDAGDNLNVDFTLQVDTDNYDISGLSGVTPDGKFTAMAEGKGTISKKTVTAEMNGGSYNKTYDGTKVLKNADDSVVTADELRNLVTVDGLYDDGSNVTVSGSYAEKDAGEQTINYLIASNDALKKNYILTGAGSDGKIQVDRTGTISKATMSATDATAAIRAFDGTTTAYNDINGGNQEISLTLTGVNGESVVIKNSEITDDNKHFSGDYGTHESTADNFTPDKHVYYVGNQPGYKSVKYSGVKAAAEWVASNGSDEQKNILKNYNITDTAYFSEAQEKGKIVPLAVTADAVKSKWNAVTKVYDGTNVVKESDTAGLQLYMEVGDKEVPITYTTSSAVYDNNQVDVGENLGVTYTLAGIIGQYSGDYSMSDADKQSFIGKVYKSTEATEASQRTPGSITKRGVYVAPKATTPEKVYDATDGVDNPSKYIEIDKTKVVSDTGIIGTDDVSVVVGGGKYDTVDAGENKDVTYSNLSLDGTKAGNYKLLNADGTDMTIDDTVTGKGKINPYEIAVEISDTVNDIRKVYDKSSEIDPGKVLMPVSNGDGTGKDLVFTDKQTETTVSGGLLSADGKTLTYKPTAGDPIIVNISSEFVDSDGNKHSDASGLKELGVNYYLKWDNKNFKLVRTDGTDIINPTNPVTLSATLRGENMGTITQREILIDNIYAEKVYDGTDAVTTLNSDKTTAINLAGNDTVNDLGIIVTGGKYDDPNAADSESQERKDHTVSDVTFTISNGNYKLADGQTTDGTGVINRKTITANPTPITTAPGTEPQFSGSFDGFVGDDGAHAAQDFEWKSDSYPSKISEKGSYEVYAWYTNGNRREGYYGYNYTFSTPSNTAWTVGSTDPLDPTNPDSPFNPDNPMYPSKPDSPLNPNSDVGQAIAQASKFKPDDKSYNRASHDDNIEHFGQQSAISIQYEDAGVNVGDEEAVVGKRSLIGIESAGNVVNLGDAEMRAGSIGIESNGVNLGSTAEQAAIEAGLPSTESYEAVPAVTTAEQEEAVAESPFLSRLRQGQGAASDESNNGEVSTGISIITADPEDEDEEEKKNRAALMARSDRETHIGIETIGGGVNMAAAVR